MSGSWTVSCSDNESIVQASTGFWDITLDASTVSLAPERELPQHLALHANYPNPFNPSTRIRYELPARMYISLDIYNLLGELQVELVSETQEGGWHELEWIPESGSGRPMDGGVYVAVLLSSEQTITAKLLYLK